jgi:hypothetical protein
MLPKVEGVSMQVGLLRLPMTLGTAVPDGVWQSLMATDIRKSMAPSGNEESMGEGRKRTSSELASWISALLWQRADADYSPNDPHL